MPETPA